MFIVMGRNRRFSDEQAAEMAQLYTSGLTIKQLAEKTGANMTVVYRSLQRSGVTMRPRSSPRPAYEWVKCACGKRAAYRTGQCVRCYNVERNQLPYVKNSRFNWRLMRHHNLPRAAYDALLESQGGVCAVCQNLDPRNAQLAVDHDHACCPADTSCDKCRRGLLCVNCNRATGLLKDDPASVARLLDYLTRHQLETQVSET